MTIVVGKNKTLYAETLGSGALTPDGKDTEFLHMIKIKDMCKLNLFYKENEETRHQVTHLGMSGTLKNVLWFLPLISEHFSNGNDITEGPFTLKGRLDQISNLGEFEIIFMIKDGRFFTMTDTRFGYEVSKLLDEAIAGSGAEPLEQILRGLGSNFKESTPELTEAALKLLIHSGKIKGCGGSLTYVKGGSEFNNKIITGPGLLTPEQKELLASSFKESLYKRNGIVEGETEPKKKVSKGKAKVDKEAKKVKSKKKIVKGENK